MASLRFYDMLEAATIEVDKQNADPLVTKHDLAQYTRSVLLQLMTRMVTAPLIGEEFAYPGDIDLRPWFAPLSDFRPLGAG